MILSLALALLLDAAAVGGPPPPPPFTAAMSHAVDALGYGEVHSGHTPGLAIGVVEDGRLVYTRGFGYADTSKHIAFEATTQSYVGAVSEQFTAAAVLLLEQDGKIRLTDRVTKYVPELNIANNVTIAQLLQQTSGLPDYTKAPKFNLDRTRPLKLSDLIASVDKMPMAAEPGSKFAYNDFNYLIAGTVVERVSGVPISDYLQQHIFLPLIMSSSFYAGDNGISPVHATGYTRASNGFVPARPWDPTWMYGDDGLVSDVYDLAKWDIEFPILLRDDAVRAMFTASGAPGNAQYGMGWVIDVRGGQRFIWQNGEVGGYRAMNALIPDQHIAVIVLTNADEMTGPGVTAPEEITSDILDIISPPPPTRLDNSVLERAREWLGRVTSKKIDRTQLTTRFSNYLTDAVLVKSNFAAMGPLQSIVPVSSESIGSNDTEYDFLVHYPKGTYHYHFTLSKDGKIDGLQIVP